MFRRDCECGEHYDVFMDRRNICPKCGFDLGRIKMYPVKFEVDEDENPHLRFMQGLIRDALLEV